MVSTKLRVKEMLRERRWTTKVLAEKTGMSESYLTHIKNGTRRWNEDALKKLAIAFEVDTIDVFAHVKGQPAETQKQDLLPEAVQMLQQEHVDLKLKIVPVVSQIPEQPTQQNNRLLQKETGCEGKFIPALGHDSDDIFCLLVQDNSLAPRFTRGDYLVIVPGAWTNSGDIVAIEYKEHGQIVREIAQINFSNDLVVLESVNHRKPPKALTRGKDHFRILGKVVCRYQQIG